MSKALEIASERYAKGEITKEEFEEMKASLPPSKEDVPLKDFQKETSSAGTQRSSDETYPKRPTLQASPSTILPTSYFDISGLHNALNFLIKGCAAISGIAAFLILKRSGGVQRKYDLVYELENEPIFIAIAGLPLLVTMVVFLIWMKKSTDNLFVLRGSQSITPAGSVYWYFVPIAWFWKPYEAMRNMVVGFNMKSEDHWLLPTWWGLFWGSAAVAIVAGMVFSDGVSTIQQANTYVTWSIIIYAADAISLIAAWGLVDSLSKAQKEEIQVSQAQ